MSSAPFAATFAPNFAVLLALRLTQGLGAAATRVVATAVVRDRAGRDMAEVMSRIFMVFMAMPIIAPGVGQVLLLTGPWQSIFVFMAGLATLISLWAFFRLPETLHPEYRRAYVQVGYRRLRHRLHEPAGAFYGLAGMFLFGAMFGFVSSSQQISSTSSGSARSSPSPSRPWRE